MNSNLFADPLLNGSNTLESPSLESASFGNWGNQEYALVGSGFQQDGPQMQGWNAAGATDGFGSQSMPPGLFAAITNAIAQYFQGSSQGGGGGTPYGYDGATPFQSLTASSTGDPHDAVSGTTRGGQSINSHWDSMQSHADLLSAPSLAGGLRLSSEVGNPNGQGATMNQSVTATADHGRTAISFDANGDASVRQGNRTNTLVPDETLSLGNGLAVTDKGNSLQIHAQNMQGGMLNTTLTDNGQGGVDVNASGQNVALGGYLINSSSQM